jgi:hypothetical protein
MTGSWREQLHGEPADLAKLPGWFDRDIARVSFDGAVCYLTSLEFDEGMDPREVAASAREIVVLITGIALQLYDREISVRAAPVQHWDNSTGQGHTFVVVDAAMNMSAIRGLNVTVDGKPKSQQEQAAILIEMAHREPDVADVLALLG